MIDTDRRRILAAEIDEAFVSELTLSFFADARPLVEDAIRGYAAADTVAARRALHTIAGSAGNIGLQGIADAADAANRAVKSGLSPDFVALRKAMDATAAALEHEAA